MVVLDTDLLSLLERSTSVETTRLRERLAALAQEDIATTIISFEEQMRGWLSYLARAKALPQQVEAYKRLKKHLVNYRRRLVLGFDERAAEEFERLQHLRLRIGTMDLKIAAIVLAHQVTLLSRNLQHFRQVPGLDVEDWTV